MLAGWHAHGRRHQLTGELSAGRERANEKIARARGCARSTDSLVRLRLIDRSTDIDRARQRGRRLASLCGQSDSGA